MSTNITNMYRQPPTPRMASPRPQAHFEFVARVASKGDAGAKGAFPDIPGATKENTSNFTIADTETARSLQDSLTRLQEYGFIPPADEASEPVNPTSGTQPEETDDAKPIADGSDGDDIVSG